MLPSTLIIIILIIILLIIITSKYRKENDIKTFNIKIDKKYNKKEEIVKRLHDLLIYDKESVLWPYTLLTSMIISTGLLYVINSLNLRNYIISVIFLFLTIEFPRRWANTHTKIQRVSEASQLLGKYNKI